MLPAACSLAMACIYSILRKPTRSQGGSGECLASWRPPLTYSGAVHPVKDQFSWCVAAVDNCLGHQQRGLSLQRHFVFSKVRTSSAFICFLPLPVTWCDFVRQTSLVGSEILHSWC